MYDASKSIEFQKYIQIQLGIIRKKKSITQEQLASSINLSPKTLSDIENNRRGISVKTLIKICIALKIDIKKPFIYKIRNDKKNAT